MFNLPQLSVWQAVLQAAPFEACIRWIKDTAKSCVDMEGTMTTITLDSIYFRHIAGAVRCPMPNAQTSQETPSQKLEEKVGISTGLMINSLMVEPVEDSGT